MLLVLCLPFLSEFKQPHQTKEEKKVCDKAVCSLSGKGIL
ncbi:hypothetical protein QY97_01078 [Bacillus thermotolerans]|nr:hypothetical protein QY97_01078 [Bacillus thermotolerans]KKB44556.1 hypothetical protein QY96_02176 [Bacillus thermotolerans]